MKQISVLWFTFVFALTILTRDARAESRVPERTTFALIVTSNHGASGARPDLHYADDDGVKYRGLFQMLAPASNVVLHTEVDRDTERLYPSVRSVALPPTKDALAASIKDLAERVHAVRARGDSAEFYFVFAGHGDVDAGIGFLELRDARFTSLDLESMLRTIDATRSHVILDSCNSFFVVHARKPGGRVVATTIDEVRSLGERMPNVGFFLSTSSQAEVFEWSELQAGIFSHAVRSGLTGAADANGDGDVTYEELRAFMNVASAQIKNPLYRPQVFARGPNAHATESLVKLSGAQGRTLRLDGPQTRLTLRDANDVPLVDVHKEQGATLALRLPEAWATHSFAEVSDTPAHVEKRWALDLAKDSPALLAELTPVNAPAQARGASDVFRMLFAVPFGPHAMAQAVEDVRKEDASAVYGVSEDQVQRMRNLLAQASAGARGNRLTGAAVNLSLAPVVGIAAGWAFSQNDGNAFPYILGGEAVVLAGAGVYGLLRTSAAEDANLRFAKALRETDPAKRAMVLAGAEQWLFFMRKAEHSRRLTVRALALTTAGLSLVGLVATEVNANASATPSDHSGLWQERMFYGSAFAFGTTLAVSTLTPTAIERLAELWESDPGRAAGGSLRPSVSVAPTRGGGQMQLGWTF